MKAKVKHIIINTEVTQNGHWDRFTNYMSNFIGKTYDFNKTKWVNWYKYDGFNFHRSWLKFVKEKKCKSK